MAEHSLTTPLGLVEDSRTAEMFGESRFAGKLGGELAGEVIVA